MRIFLWLLCFVLLAIVGFGVHLVLEQEWQVTSLSATTTAIILEKRLEVHVQRNIRAGESPTVSYEPVVKFRFEAQGQQFTSDNIFPDTFREGFGVRFAAKALLDRFQVGEESTAYYNPDNLAEACLIRRPSILPYLFMLLPVIVVSGLVAFLWRSSQPGGIEFKRRKGGWIAALWHIVGLASGGHYFYLAGAEYGGVALVLFSFYAQLGLVPVGFALPPSKSSEFAKRVKVAIGCSLFGTFVGIWLGLLVGWVAMALFSASATVFLHCWGYGMAIPAVLFFLLGLLMSDVERQKGKRQVKTEGTITPAPTPSVGSAPKSEEFVPMPSPDGPIPYQIDQRPMPRGEDLQTLLPAQVGPFRRAEMDDPDEVRNAQIYAEYRSEGAGIFSDAGKISVELGVCGDPARAQRGVETSKAETDAEFPDAAQLLSLKTEPSFFKSNTPRGAFMSWTRGGYYFSAHARSGKEDLDRFMEAFPY